MKHRKDRTRTGAIPLCMSPGLAPNECWGLMWDAFFAEVGAAVPTREHNLIRRRRKAGKVLFASHPVLR